MLHLFPVTSLWFQIKGLCSNGGIRVIRIKGVLVLQRARGPYVPGAKGEHVSPQRWGLQTGPVLLPGHFLFWSAEGQTVPLLCSDRQRDRS